jgi:hypothetical protein
MLELVTRNKFALPVNPMDVGLNWGRKGFTCNVARELDDLHEAEAASRKRKPAPRPKKLPAQTVMSAGLFGPFQPTKPPKSLPPLAIVREEHLLDREFIAVAMRGGLVAWINKRKLELFPGDELQVAAGTLCEISVVSARTRWLFGYRE